MELRTISLSELKDAEPSATEDESTAMMLSVVRGDSFPGWLRYDSDLDDDVYELAEIYVNQHAYIKFGDEVLYSTTPIHVLECYPLDEKLGEDVRTRTKGLLYSNGAVFLGYRPDEILTILYVDDRTLKSFNYPPPSHYNFNKPS